MNFTIFHALMFITFGVMIFAGLIMSDYAKKKLGWRLWDAVTIIGIIGFVGSVLYLFLTQHK